MCRLRYAWYWRCDTRARIAHKSGLLLIFLLVLLLLLLLGSGPSEIRLGYRVVRSS